MFDILLVDDQDEVRADIRTMISDMNLDISGIYDALDYSTALEAARKHKPDIILVDIMMPGLDGMVLIQSLREENINSHIVIVSSYDDFRYTKKAINYKVDDYLLKPVSRKELYSVLLSVMNTIRKDMDDVKKIREQENQYLNMLLFEHITGKDVFINTEKLFDNLGMNPAISSFAIAIVNVEGKEWEAVSDLKKAIDELFIQMKYTVYFIYNGSDKLIVIVCFKVSPDDTQSLEFTEILKKYFSGKAFCGVSDIAEGLQSLRELYRQADIALKESVFKGLNICFFSKVRKDNSFFVDANMCAEILGLLLKGKKTEIDGRLYEIFIRITKENYSIMEVKNSLQKLVDYLHLKLTDEYLGTYDIENARKLLHNSQKIFTIKVNLKKIIDDMFDFIKQDRTNINDNNIVDYILKYIKNNYARDISLTQVANELSMNYSYVSNLFTLKAGRTFSHYLMQFRLEKAKNLLLTKDDKVHEIALKSGYGNSKYFCRVFKEQTDLTPSEYRNMYAQKH